MKGRAKSRSPSQKRGGSGRLLVGVGKGGVVLGEVGGNGPVSFSRPIRDTAQFRKTGENAGRTFGSKKKLQNYSVLGVNVTDRQTARAPV